MSHPKSTASMPPPDPRYLRPSIPPWIMDMYRHFSEICRAGDIKKVAKLVELEPRSQEYLTKGLCAAIMNKHIHIAEFLLNLVGSIEPEVVLAATLAKSIPIFEILLDHSWDVDAPYPGDSSPLLSVLEDEQLIKWFLDHGALLDPPPQSSNPSIAQAFKATFSLYLDTTASKSSVEVFDLLLEGRIRKGNSLALHMAAGSGQDDERLPMMAHLIHLGYDFNADDEARGNRRIGTPLHYALMAKSLAKTNFLLQKGADPHKPVGRCGSAFKMAELLGMDDLIILMQQYPENL